MKPVTRSAPSKRTTEPATKPLPVTVSGTEEPPCGAEEGESDEMCGSVAIGAEPPAKR